MAVGDHQTDDDNLERIKQELAIEDLAAAIRDAGNAIAESLVSLSNAIDRASGHCS